MNEASNSSRTKEIFLDALVLARDERTTFLESACDGDAALRERVEALITAYERSHEFENLAVEPGPPLALVGDYELTEELGRGAAGIVYRARQTSLGREVALKILRAGSFASENDVRRFRREAEAAAALDHPRIVPVFDIGQVDGHHFFSMKLVDGTSLDRVLDRFEGDPRGAARLVATVARAVHHAHRRGVLHRDLKPSNILLDEEGAPHVADFGIAQPLDQARITQTGLVCGTPAYMSPEQTRGGEDITVATDIWSLGCVLHELLVGTPPFGGDGVAEVLRRVQEDPPPRLSHIDRDLSTVIGACLAKDPAGRYPTALSLAEDLERWLDHLPITARPTTQLERLRLLCRRSPVATFLGIAVVLLLLVLGIGATVTSLILQDRLAETQAAQTRANERLRSALVANARAERRSEFAGRRALGLDFLRQAAAIEAGPDLRDDAITTLTLPDLVSSPGWEFTPWNPLAVDDDFERMVMAHPDGRVDLRASLDGKMITHVSSGGQARGAAFTHASGRLWLSRKETLDGTPPRLEVWDLATRPPSLIDVRDVVTHGFLSRSHDGRAVALARSDGTVELIDAETFEIRSEKYIAEQIARCAFRPDGGALAVPTTTDKGVVVVSIPDWESLATLQLTATVPSVDWSPKGDLLIAACFDQNAYIWDTSNWKQRTVLHGHGGEVVQVSMLPGRLAATHAWDRTTRIWDVEVGSELLRCNTFLFAAERDGNRLLLRSEKTFELAELLSGDVLRELHAHEGKAPREVAESPDGRFLATCGDDGWLLWDARTHKKLAVVPSDEVHSVVFEPSGDAVVTGGHDGLLRWPLSTGDAPEIGDPQVIVAGACERADVSPDGRWLAVAKPPRALLLDREGGQRELGNHTGLDRVTFSRDGTWVAVGSWGGTGMRVWATDTGKLAAHLLPDANSAMATFSPDNTRLVVATFEQVVVFRVGEWTRECAFDREGPRYPSLPAAFSPNGGLMAMGIARGRVRLVSTDDWHTIADLQPAKPHNLFHMRFLSGGRRLAIATPDHRLLIWELETIWAELAQRDLIDSAELPLRTTR